MNHHRRRVRVGLSALVLAFAPLGACSGDDDAGSGATGSEEAVEPLAIGQVQTFEVSSNVHVDHVVDYPQTPPVGGDHAARWQNCGFYDDPIYNEAGVHSLEHGAVWITFQPSLSADQIDQIRALADQPYVLASPWPTDNLGAPIVLSAWGVQLALESLPSPQADDFLNQYRQAASAPEPGAPCTGGITETR